MRIVLILALALSSQLMAQQKTELGIFAGSSSYLGDLNPDILFKSPDFSLGVLHIYNINKRFALRNQVNYARLSAASLPTIGAAFQSSLVDLSSRFEISYRPFKLVDRKRPVTTYLNGGIGAAFILNMPTGSPVQLTLPFGVGVKAGISRRMCVGIEFSGRKTFTDKIDGVENRIYETANLKPGFFINNDWYTVAGLFLTYKIFDNPGDCPVYDE